ncbi:hypothetical protein M885DRAFT_35328 [Pelagophyceae sp. CCMP2097]|nr:hypothetical protein M885DRAFT_35328 [Pelagophyceae sp. CCMP2097]
MSLSPFSGPSPRPQRGRHRVLVSGTLPRGPFTGTFSHDSSHRDLVTRSLSQGPCRRDLVEGTLLGVSRHRHLVRGFSSQAPWRRVLVTGTLSQGPCRKDLVACRGDVVAGIF